MTSNSLQEQFDLITDCVSCRETCNNFNYKLISVLANIKVKFILSNFETRRMHYCAYYLYEILFIFSVILSKIIHVKHLGQRSEMGLKL